MRSRARANGQHRTRFPIGAVGVAVFTYHGPLKATVQRHVQQAHFALESAEGYLGRYLVTGMLCDASHELQECTFNLL